MIPAHKLRALVVDDDSTMAKALDAHFPAGHSVVEPDGGYFLWVELPAGSDAMALHRAALKKGISIAPGPIFATGRRFANALRINTGHPVTAEIEIAIATLGRLARR